MFSAKDLAGFANAAHSLKLYRRADLRDEGNERNLIGKLYVDPLQGSAVLDTMLRDSTTFLIGRKGTGKSTIFQRAQHELRSRANAISAYVDIKTVYEAADVDPTIPTALADAGLTLTDSALKKVLLYRAFIRAVFSDIKKELKDQAQSTAMAKILEKLGHKKGDLISRIDELLEGSFEARITDISAIKTLAKKISTKTSGSSKSKVEAKGHAKVDDSFSLGVDVQASAEQAQSKDSNNASEFSEVLLRTFDINRIIEELADTLSSVGIKKLYIFIDDFSELPEEAMKVFVDTVLAPLNNWSNELIKFKVAAYPGRIYLGRIDPTKSDEVYLDLFRLYGDKDVGTMEDKGADFTRRLIDSRFKHFVGKEFATFCDSDPNAVYRQLFFASMANPRILGHILTNLRDSVTVYHRAINTRAVQAAAVKYYEDKVEPFFGIHKFALESFSERASSFSLKELLEGVVTRARELRDYKDSRVTRGIPGRTPSSHFHISTALDSALRTLELNFFITLYYEMKDRDGNKVSVYALNYGLCNKYTISFGRPTGQRDYRLYFIERIFDYTTIVRRFLESNQEIKCSECREIYSLDKLDGLVMYDMLCPKCKKGTCIVTNLSRKYESIINSVDPALMLPATELSILEALFTEEREMVAAEIAGELDCSYQLVGRRGRNLADRGLVSRSYNEGNRRIFSITADAKRDYFEGNRERVLDVKDDL